MIDPKDDEPGVLVVGHVLTGAREVVDTAELTWPPSHVLPHPPLDLASHLFGLPLELRRAALRDLRDRGLCGMPVPGPVLVEIGRLSREPPQRVAEDCGRFSWHHTAQPDPPVLDALLGRSRDRGRAQVDGARHSTAGVVLSQVGHLGVRPHGKGVRPVHVLTRSPAPSCPAGTGSVRIAPVGRPWGSSRAGSAGSDRPAPTGCGSRRP